MLSGSELPGLPRIGKKVLLPARVLQVIEPNGKGISTVTMSEPIAIIEVPGAQILAFPTGELRST